MDGRSINQQKVQNLVIRDACEKRGFHYKLSFTEYGIKDCYLNYNEMLTDFKKGKFDGIAFYSLAQLPEKKNTKNKPLQYYKNKKKKNFIQFRKYFS